jgi:hypothetical protein
MLFFSSSLLCRRTILRQLLLSLQLNPHLLLINLNLHHVLMNFQRTNLILPFSAYTGCCITSSFSTTQPTSAQPTLVAVSICLLQSAYFLIIYYRIQLHLLLHMFFVPLYTVDNILVG